MEVGDVDMLREPESDREGICRACNSSNYVAPPGPTPT